jgi:SPP1 gp7 family putative phage head morphogenesis protein
VSLRRTLAQVALKAIGKDTFGQILSNYGMSSPARLGTRQLLKAYNTMPWLRGCVQKSSWSVATNRWQLFVAQSKGKAIRDDIFGKAHNTKQRHQLIMRGLANGDLREIQNNAFLDFMQAGTPPFFNGIIANQLTQQHQDLVGESLWVMERRSIGGKGGRGVPMSYWVIPPSWIQGVPTINHPFFEIVAPYGTKTIPAEDCVWSYSPDPSDPYQRGSGIGHVLGDELETDEYAAKYMKSFFYNDARPPFLVSVPGVDKTETDRLATWWQTKHQGFGRWWRPGFVNREFKIHEFGQTMQNLQMVPIREYERNTILQVYGMPPEIFGIVESSNRATADAAKAIYGEHVVQPRLEFRRATFQTLANEEFDERLIVDFVSPIPEDKEYQLKVMQALSYNFKVDEHRSQAGYSPLEDGSGNVHMVPFTVVPRARIDEEDEPVKPTPDAKGPRKIKIVTKDIDDDDIDELVDAVAPEKLSKRTSKIVKSAVEKFGQDRINEVSQGVDFNVRSPKVERFLENFAGNRIKRINETTTDQLRETLRAGVAAGESTRDIAARIREVFEDATDSRATTIARSEIGRASNFGSTEGMKQAGIEQKEWLATQDDVVRDTHSEMDGQRVGIDEEFESPAGGRAEYPGDFGEPEEDINCRCTVLSVFDERSARQAMWKSVESERAPFDRQMRRALRQGFADQLSAVLSELKRISGDSIAA